ncbi:bifunctional 2',3'-cyclic-nucleotide 2'-phosphodiesterase/3'-nucleotidase [Neobacillus sp. LXY-1]|uniref:bifunctional 2',3'-cyclic-nucleotide 2'-phosphodiesterase/3'-nucleotidase n=1 Tax=Neobacillus sp. LXY-1 TaxID=3379133 RepID=UPI003EE13660
MKRKIKRSMTKRMLNTSLATVLAFTTIPLNMFPGTAKAEVTGTAESTVKMRFLETTDLHDNVMDYDYYQDKATTDYGLDRTAVLIKQAREEKINSTDASSPTYQQNSMLFDAGDLLQGNPMADYVAKIKKLAADEQHPMFKAMSLLNYDAGIVGNHEFNYGLDYLNNALQEVPYNVVNANIYKDNGADGDSSNDTENYFTPYKIIEKQVVDQNGQTQTIHVGVIGFAPPQIMQWDKDNLSNKVTVKDIVKTANTFIPQMKAAGADVIVAIAHSGCDVAVTNSQDAENAENAVFALSKVPGIDALLFGHAHLNFPGDATFNGKTDIDNTNGKINNVPAMEAGYWGNNLGVMDLTLQKVNGQWTVADSKAALRSLKKQAVDADGNPVFDANKKPVMVPSIDGPDQEIVNAVKEYHDGTLAYVRGKIGETTTAMNSYFSRVMDDPTIQIVNDAQTDYVKDFIAKNRPDLKDIPVISAGAPFKAGRQGITDYTYINKGDLSIKSANDLYLYNNTLKAVELTGAQVKEWLEMSASQFNRIDPAVADPQELIDYGFQPFNFDVIDGVKYQIDVTQPARYNYTSGDVVNQDAHRIIHFTDMKGNPIADDQRFIVATNNYRASGGGNFPGTKGGHATLVVDSPDENRQVLMNYIQNKGTVNPTADNNWKIAPVGGEAKLVFRSSPEAVTKGLPSQPAVKDVGPQTVNGVTWEQYSLDQNVHVQLLGINDFHGQLDYSTTVSGKPVGGIQYLAGYLKEREATNPANTLMVQAGDLVGASRPVSALLQDEPTIRFMNELGMDVGTIGNHEFDEGVKEMLRLINGGAHPKTVDKYGAFEGAKFNYIAANVKYTEGEHKGELVLPPYAIKEVDGVKIGFIGVVTTETPTIVTPSGVAGVEFTDEVEAINTYAQELKSKGIKSIVVLAHDPGTSSSDGSNPTGQVVDIAKAIDPEVDVVYGAHDHKYLNSTVTDNTGKQKLLVQSYSYGTAFSDVDLTIDPVTEDIVTKTAQVQSTFQDPAHFDAGVKAELDKYLADVAPTVNRVVGTTNGPIAKLQNTSGEAPMGDVIADAMRAKTGTQFAFMNAGGVRDEIKQAGNVTYGDLFAIQPFGNDVVSLNLTGEQVRTVINQEFRSDRYRIMQISGLTYTWSDALPIGEKVVDIYLPDGSKIDPNAVYSVTVNNFMADGGDFFAEFKNGTNRKTWSGDDLQTLVDYVSSLNAPIDGKYEGRMRQLEVTPEAPVVNPVYDKDTNVTGTTVAQALVQVKDGQKIISTATAGDDGSFTVSIPTPKAGKTLTVTAIKSVVTDPVKNIISQNVSFDTKVEVADGTAPEAPVVDEVTDKSTTITGEAEAGAKVEARVNDVVVGSTVADTEGNFSMDISVLPAYTEVFVTATDAAHNVSEAAKVVVKDVTDPGAPSVDPITNMSTTITGKAEAGSHVVITDNKGFKVNVIADEDGNFTVTLLEKLAAGTVLYIFTIDTATNVSPLNIVTVMDVIAPAKASVNEVRDFDKQVIGKAEPGSTVTVKAGTVELGHATTDKYGNFSVTLKAAQKADTVLTIIVTDKAGNVSEEVQVTVVDKTAPVKPVVNQVKDFDKKVTGKAEPGSKVTVKKGSTVLGTAVADKYGNYSVTLKAAQPAGTVLTVTAADNKGNVSSITTTTVVDKTAPTAPSVDSVTSKTTKVTGKTEAYAKVEVKAETKVIGTATADKYGKFSVTISKQKAGTALYVTAKDTAGNVSAAKKVTVK